MCDSCVVPSLQVAERFSPDLRRAGLVLFVVKITNSYIYEKSVEIHARTHVHYENLIPIFVAIQNKYIYD